MIIGFIDKFVAMVDRVATWPKLTGQKHPSNFVQVINVKFPALTTHISHLVSQAETNPEWRISAEDLKLLDTRRNELVQDCRTWIQAKDTKCLWDTMGWGEPVAWVHAGYLRDEMTKQPRTVGQGAGTMKLRPKARIKYTP